MNACKFLPKLPLKTFACDSGGYLRDTNRLMTMRAPPEIPLTKALTEECYPKPPKLPSHHQAIRPPKTTCTNAQIKKNALSGLSNWYNNHLTAMNAIQKFKEFREEDDRESQNYYDQLANFNYSKSLMYKRQAAGPHIDLENYLMSLKSRQKELSSFTNQSKAWERYFAKAIPGWTEIKQRKNIDAEIMDKIVEGLHKLDVGSKLASQQKVAGQQQQPKKLSSESITDNHLDTEVGYQRTPTNPQQVKQNRLSVRFIDDLRANQTKAAAYYADMEDRARTIFQQIPEVKIEGKGHINNEILFEDVYGKYLAGRREKSGTDKGKGKSKSKVAKHLKHIKRSKGKDNKKKRVSKAKTKEKSTAQTKQQCCAASPTANNFFEVTDDPKVFTRDAACSPESPTRVLLVGNKKKTKALLTRKDINSQQMLVVDSNNKNVAKPPSTCSELGTAKPKQPRSLSNCSSLSFA